MGMVILKIVYFFFCNREGMLLKLVCNSMVQVPIGSTCPSVRACCTVVTSGTQQKRDSILGLLEVDYPTNLAWQTECDR